MKKIFSILVLSLMLTSCAAASGMTAGMLGAGHAVYNKKVNSGFLGMDEQYEEIDIPTYTREHLYSEHFSVDDFSGS